MIYDIFYISKSKIHDSDWTKFRQRFPLSQKIENVKSFDDVRSKAFTKFFYVVWEGTEVLDFDFSYKVAEWDEQYIHVWKTLRNQEETYQGGIALFPKNVNLVSSREFANKFYLNKKELEQVTSRQVYPQYIINTYAEYKEIIENTSHDMFWLVWNNIVKIDSDIFDLYFDPNNGQYDYDRNENHMFKNACYNNESYLNGIVLCSKNKPITQKEFDRKYIISKKEHEEVLSRFRYPQFNIQTYNDYLAIIDKVEDPLFWYVPSDIEVTKEDIFNFYFDPNDGKYDYDRNENHVFKNGEYYDGLVLFSKNKKISEREFNFRFLADKKEWDIVVSKPKLFETHYINSYDQYLDLLKTCKTNMFYAVWPDIDLVADLNCQVPYYDQHITHVFKNGNYYDGVCLLSVKEQVTQREFENRFFVNKKEIDILVSQPKPFETHHISTYDEYLFVLENCKTNMFWVVWPDIELIEDLNYQVPYYDQHITHVFLNDEFYDGVVLFSKTEIVNRKEFNFRFYKNRKEISLQLSKPKSYDIFFLSYNEAQADENYEKLVSRFPNAKRVHGVKGIHNAHKKAAELSSTDMFWVVDADAQILDDFNFESKYHPHYDPGNRKEKLQTVYIYHSQNPINDLTYGYGGVKLLPKKLTENLNPESVDVTTSISSKIKVIDRVSNITTFNVTPFDTWRSAFRECVKLSSKVIDSDYDEETDVRLNIWCEKGKDRKFGDYAIAGAQAGRDYGYSSIGDNDALMKINDFEWLKEKYEQFTKNNNS